MENTISFGWHSQGWRCIAMNDYAVLINNFEEMLKQNMNLVDVIGDCPNIERPIAPETIFWKKVEEDTIRRAMERLGEEEYNLITNNCEHFAMWCKTGESISCQVNQIVRFAMASGLKGFYNVL